jgi:putative NADH-flavin reductase
MRLVVLGATGGTGQQLVRQALDGGHEVIAIARRPDAVTITDSRLTIVRGDVVDPSWSGAGIDRAHAVLSALGTRVRGTPTTVYSAGTAAVIKAMTSDGLRRLVVVGSAVLGPESRKSLVERGVVHPILQHFFGALYDDMRTMERLLSDCSVDWTVFHPARLTDGRERGRYRVAVDDGLRGGWRISRADLAAAMLAAVDDASLFRRVVTIAY